MLIVVNSGARDGTVELLHILGGAVNQGGAGVDDGVEPGQDRVGADFETGTTCLPDTCVLDVVVLDLSHELGGVSAPEEEFRAGGSKCEAELPFGDLALGDGSVEERALKISCQGRKVNSDNKEVQTCFKLDTLGKAKPMTPSKGSPA